MKNFISCDWGTSNFRLCLTDREDASVLAEFIADKGVSSIFKQWQEAAKPDRFQYYLDYLKHAIGLLEVQAGMSLTGLPLVVSGMASSTIGMKELPYAVLAPGFVLANLYIEKIEESAAFRHTIYMVSGIRTENDVMRGEETKWIGMEIDAQASVCCVLPGTHPKHILLYNGQLQQFSTYLTGELFTLLNKEGILAASVEKNNAFLDHREAFLAGVTESGQAALLSALFTVRTNQLFDRFSKAGNYWYLSGLLIGSELRALEAPNWFLCSDGLFTELYKEAAMQLGISAPRWLSAGAALRNGQRLLLDID